MPQIVVPSTEYISPAPTTELTEPQSEDNGINNGMPDDEENINKPQQPINEAVAPEPQQPAVT